MLARMYTRWAEQHGYKVEWLEESPGEEAGLKSATLRVLGENAYGWLKTESGVHRLVRISPFDSNARRHTSFASVWVYPVVDDKIEIAVEDKYLRVDTYRSSGAGGQHVNKTDSAVRMTYLPPGIETPVVVACQSERSQHQNRAKAMAMLKARLYELELKRREAAVDAMNATKTDIAWGHQNPLLCAAALSASEGPPHRRHHRQRAIRARRRSRPLPASLARAAYHGRGRGGEGRGGRRRVTPSRPRRLPLYQGAPASRSPPMPGRGSQRRCCSAPWAASACGRWSSCCR